MTSRARLAGVLTVRPIHVFSFVLRLHFTVTLIYSDIFTCAFPPDNKPTAAFVRVGG